MNVDRGQILGGVLGLLTLLSAFLLPFSSIANGNGGAVDSLIAIFKLFVTTLSNIQSIPGLTQLVQLAYVYMAVFVMVVLAGILGSYPRWSGILGLFAMLIVTAAPFAIFSSYSFDPATYGLGFWAIWATSVLTRVVSFWSSRLRQAKQPAPEAAPPAPAPAAPAQA